MKDTIVTNERQPMDNNNVNNNAGKSNTWQQVAIGGVAGIAIGGLATAAAAAVTVDEAEVAVTPDDGSLEGVNGTAHIDSMVPVAEVSDDMSFGEAFAAAHEQVGPGGVFVWHGQVYNTYTADEWNSMTPAEHAEFGSHVHIAYDEPEPVYHPTTPEVPVTPEPVVEITYEEPHAEVLSYETVTNSDGTQMEMAVVEMGGQQAAFVDVDLDGTAEVMLSEIIGD